MATESGRDDTFESIDWSEQRAPRRLGPATTGFLVAAGALLALYLYDAFFVVRAESLLLNWRPIPLDWLAILSGLFMTFYLVVPLYRNRRLTRQYWRRLRSNRLAVAALAYLAAFAVVGLAGPVVVGPPADAPMNLDQSPYGVAPYQPPVGFTADADAIPYCAGTVSDGRCHGTALHPFGTTSDGKDVLGYVVAGTRVALEVALVTSMLLVPLATLVGTVAAQYGGRVDTVLMRYVDVQQVIPAFFVYIVAQYLYGGSLLLIILVFGVFNWGGIARQVRSDALQKTGAEYVKAARSAGLSRAQVVRRHLVPNVSNTVVTAVTLQIPTIIIVETTLSFLGLSHAPTPSWGTVINLGVNDGLFPELMWWSVAFPLVFLVVTVVAFNVLGDALRDVLDPRGEGGR